MKKCILVLAVVAVLFSTCYAQSALTRMMLLQSLMGNQQGSGAAGSSTGTGAGSTGSASSNLLSGSGGLSSLMLMNGKYVY